MAYAKAKGLRVWLNTNGSLITENIVRDLEQYVEDVLLPFNGHDAESDKRWTNTYGSFDAKVRAAHLLCRSKIPVVRAGTVATPQNIDSLDTIFSVVQDCGISTWEVYRPVSHAPGDTTFDAGLLYQKLVRLSMVYGKLIPIANAFPFCCSEPQKLALVSTGACYDDGHTRLVIDPAGFAKPSYFIHKDMGDPRDIGACWNHSFMKQMRTLALVPDCCRRCAWLTKCKGGSRYAANLVSSSSLAPDPLMEPIRSHGSE
jgi:radical SAM protein with 4Fe4S-binding SPASM domain